MSLARWLILPLATLWLAAPAGAQDLEEIARVMAEREQATYPFAVSYRVQVRSGGREAEPGMFPAWVAHRTDRMLWKGGVDDDGVRKEHCWARDGTTWSFVRHDPEVWWLPWRGEIGASPKFTWRLLPSDFGLELASQRMSSFLRRPSARIRGRESVEDFDCVVVLVDWVDPTAPRIQHPLALWLAVGHDYYPVQVVRYVREAYPDIRNEDRITVDGLVYKPDTWRVVDELTTVGRARFPVRGRQLSRSRFQDAMQIDVDRATLRLGSAVTEDDFDLPGWMYVVDRRSGTPYFVTPLGPIPLSGIAVGIYVIVALAVALEARRRWKRRRRQKADATVWDDVRE
jgi:hypothetical protein